MSVRSSSVIAQAVNPEPTCFHSIWIFPSRLWTEEVGAGGLGVWLYQRFCFVLKDQSVISQSALWGLGLGSNKPSPSHKHPTKYTSHIGFDEKQDLSSSIVTWSLKRASHIYCMVIETGDAINVETNSFCTV